MDVYDGKARIKGAGIGPGLPGSSCMAWVSTVVLMVAYTTLRAEGQLGDGTSVNASKKDPVVVTIKLFVKILDLGTGPSSQRAFFCHRRGRVLVGTS